MPSAAAETSGSRDVDGTLSAMATESAESSLPLARGPESLSVDPRTCKMCGNVGDAGDAERLLYGRDQDAWIHLNCMLWSAEVYESEDGDLMAVDTALVRSQRLVRGRRQRLSGRGACAHSGSCRTALSLWARCDR